MRIGEATNEQDLVAALDQAKERRQQLRLGWETRWWNNIALVQGDHFASWNPTSASFEDRDPVWQDLDGKKPRMVINHALTVFRTELAKLSKGQPILEVIANSDDAGDIAATKVAKSGLDYAEWKFRLRRLRKTAYTWLLQTGLGCVYVGWDYLDDNMGTMDFVIDPATGEPTFNSERQRQLEEMLDQGELSELKRESYPLGDLDFCIKTPFQLFPDETALEWDKIRNLIVTDAIDVDILRGTYGKAARDLKPDVLQLGTMDRRMLQRMGTYSPAEATVDNASEVNTFWLLPNTYRGNSFLENGCMVRWVKGRKILDFSAAFPYQDGRIPYVFFEHIPSATSIWPDCVINHIRGPNLEIDKTVSQLIENKDYMANPMWRIATQHKIKGKIKNVAGGIVKYVHVPNIPPPEPIQGLQMPPQVENLLAGLREQIMEISGQSEVARGRVPTGVRSGVAVAYLQEEDDTKIAPTVENMEEGLALMGSIILERYSQFYTIPRVIRFYRPDGIFDALKFKGADLKNNTDVQTQAGSAMPKSKAARQQYVLELVQLGIEQDPDRIKEMLDLGEGEPDDNDKARKQADRENNTMLHGLPGHLFGKGSITDKEVQTVSAAVPVKKWHNHKIHIQRHTSIMMDPEFDTLSLSHPEIVRLFDEHLAVHQQELAAQQQQQMQMLQAAKGAPGGQPAGQQAQNGLPSGVTQDQRTMMGVPDVIAGGEIQGTARRTVQ